MVQTAQTYLPFSSSPLYRITILETLYSVAVLIVAKGKPNTTTIIRMSFSWPSFLFGAGGGAGRVVLGGEEVAGQEIAGVAARDDAVGGDNKREWLSSSCLPSPLRHAEAQTKRTRTNNSLNSIAPADADQAAADAVAAALTSSTLYSR
jgi:hypothetical protein